jgi:hypothetical protein
MAGEEFLTTLGLWFVRAFVSSLICLLLGYLSIKIVSKITTQIQEFETIKGHPLATSLFLGGFLVYAGLVIYGSMVTRSFCPNQ